MLGAIGNQPGELIQYTPTWHHGHGMMQFLPARSKTASSDRREPYKFRNQGFEFYKHPPASAYRLNRLLFDIRHSHDLRLRLLNELDSVAAEYGLTAVEKEAARTIPAVATAQRVSDHTEPLVKAGAHPLQALMSLHAVAGEYRKLQRKQNSQTESQA